MSIVSNLDPLFEVGIEARPSNYLVNHVAWTEPSERIEWTDLCLVRNTSGHPRNINDGVAIFSEGTDALTLVVAQVYGSASISNVSYAGGGLMSLPVDYETYDNLTATGDTNGAKFKVTRSAADLGKVIEVEILSFGEGYSIGNTLTIPKEDIGYDATLHTEVTDLIITVTALGGAQAGVKPVSGTGFTIKTYSTSVIIPDNGTFTYEGVEAYGTGNSKGKGATFDVTRVGNGTTSTTTVALRASGSGYKVGDILRIPASSIGRPPTVELGVEAAYHVYDTGSDVAATTNPGSGVVGQNLNNPRYYYSLFLRHNPVSGALPVWKKVAESESFAVKDNGTLETILYHLPTFYKKDAQGRGNQDLTDYLSLFAFHIDTYLAANSSVFNMMNPDVVDEKLLKLLIKQLGGTYENVSGVSQARTLLNNLIRNYKLAGSSSGVTSYLETHSGYGISLEASTNYLHDYNTSSFVESTGNWRPGNAAAYGSTAPFLSNLTLTGPLDGSFASYANYSVTLTSAVSIASIPKTVFVSDSSNIKSGSRVIVTSGTGAFAAGTVVTSVDNLTNSFKVNVAPTTNLNLATIKFSDNITSGMGKVTVAATSSPMFYVGPKKAELTATSASGTTVVTIKPNVAAVNDYVLLTTGNTGTTIPEGTYVTAVNASTSAITLSNKIGTVASGTSLILAPPPAADLPSSSVARQAVEAGKPYAFGAYFSAGGGTKRTTEVKITWYDVYGTVISTTATGTLSTSAQSDASTWYLNNITGVAPAKTAYAEPQFTINNLSASYYVDAAQFNHPITVTFKALASGTATLSTDVPHNYVIGNSVSVSGLDAPFDGTFTITDVSQDANTGVYLFKYLTTGTDTSGLCSGYSASVPSTFEDARELKLTAVANRVNLVHNPSFEIDTTSWAGTDVMYRQNQIQKILASDVASSDQFGYSVAISPDGNTAIVGAPYESTTPTTTNGAAYVFTRSGSVWSEEIKLLALDAASNENFGWSVDISSDGNTVVVGAYTEDTSSNTNNGAAYIFTRSGMAWTQQQKLLASDAASNDSFGWSVAISADGDTALIGAQTEDTTPNTDNGAAYVFTRSAGTWTEQQKLLASDVSAAANFGSSVSLSADGNTAIVGASGEDTASSGNNGAAYVFTRSGSTWTQQQKLLASDVASFENFGYSIALSADGNTAIIGAYQEDTTPNTNNGAAYIFTRSGSTWTQQQKLLASDAATTDRFGWSVNISADGNTAIVGANYADITTKAEAGAAYIFTRSGSTWTQRVKISANDATASEYFGTSVAISGDGRLLLVGADVESTSPNANNGAVYAFTKTDDLEISRVTSVFNIGTASLQAVVAAGAAANSAVVSDSALNPIKIFSGNLYTFSGYVKVASGASATYDIHVDWYDDESEDSFGTLTGAATTITTTSGWVRLSVTGEAPSGTTRAKLYFRKKTAMTNTATFLVDNVLVEKYGSLGVYFDGAYDGQNYSSDRDSMWEGTAHLSPSHLYIDKVSTFGKLDALSTDVSYYA